MIKTISFPGGSGGNWLRAVIEQEPLLDNQIHFHSHPRKQGLLVETSHSTNPSEFDYLFSGSYYFNFFVNVVYKCFHMGNRFTETGTYQDYYTESVNTARYLCSFAQLTDLIFFNFDDLITNDRPFFQQITNAFPESQLLYPTFLQYKNAFFKTMVRTDNLYENFDSQIWVTFLLGQLMNYDIVPKDFSIYNKDNQHLATQFVKDNYKHCQLRNVHHFDSNIVMPNLF